MKKLISIFTFNVHLLFLKISMFGDTLSITANGISQQEMLDAFKILNFELESCIKKENNGYLY